MKRKLEVAIAQWLPAIFACFRECENVDSQAIYQYCGRVLVVLGPEDQMAEISRVITFLKENDFLVSDRAESMSGQRHGVSFKNEVLIVTKNFSDICAAAEQPLRNSGDRIIIQRTDVKNYNFNLTFSIEKLIELNPALNVDIIAGLKSLFGLG